MTDRRSLVRKVMAALLWPLIIAGCRPAVNVTHPDDAPQRVMPTAAAESACNQIYRSSDTGKRIAWKGRVPVNFWFDAGVPLAYVEAIRSAMRTWNTAAGYELFRAEARPRPHSTPAYDGHNTIYLFAGGVPEYRRAFGRYLALGIATTGVRSEGNRIVETDIVFNGADHRLSTSRVHVDSYDVEATALHELGHALGLGHSPDWWSTMFAYGAVPVGLRLRYLDDQTKASLDCEYR